MGRLNERKYSEYNYEHFPLEDIVQVDIKLNINDDEFFIEGLGVDEEIKDGSYSFALVNDDDELEVLVKKIGETTSIAEITYDNYAISNCDWEGNAGVVDSPSRVSSDEDVNISVGNLTFYEKSFFDFSY